MLRMTTPSERVALRFVGDFGFLLSNVSPRMSGVECAVIWFSAGEYSTTETAHGAKLLVTLGEKLSPPGFADAVSVTLGAPPKVLGVLPRTVERQVVRFIEHNRAALMAHWNGEADTLDVLERLERV